MAKEISDTNYNLGDDFNPKDNGIIIKKIINALVNMEAEIVIEGNSLNCLINGTDYARTNGNQLLTIIPKN